MSLFKVYTSFSLFFSVLFLLVAFIVIYDIFDEIREFQEVIEKDARKFEFYSTAASRSIAGLDKRSLFGGAVSF
ncbi:Nematode cuticle collagen N-terminal domain-containing protein [Caenorhabditis elegans]|uniref:Nematode cuticle collagen N-terminal domain-containing protein n=1 Tax=Caenorhabditis elegans TaxID=6239 RepID=A0A2C9C2I3_CAEEL|nr:Nematode cuticle collagen N-terminal domain-containing protein [Caenorhabditis elegans]SOF58719.1 Nematode cuticle collagen N-terminal domain-containing protein [Caenorhabditis elegans]|eukprot:NP_001343728.1 Uncharacterized protein CELE_F53G12.18 [Caenorhabditis elegans]